MDDGRKLMRTNCHHPRGESFVPMTKDSHAIKGAARRL